MGDFHQHGIITSLHDLNSRPIEKLERELEGLNKKRPLGLVLPSLYSELEGPALSSIVDELQHVPYLEQIVVGLDRADESQYRHALEFFSRLPQKPQVLWNDGPRLRKIDALLMEKGLAPEEPGKGRNVWYMFGYMLACDKVEAVALHDCDITTYSRDMLARLIYPVANPNFGYKFCKGYYARVASSKMNGRVCRLLVTPLLRALKKVCGENPYLDYLDSFRYPLAGEFSLTRDVIQGIRIPSDWGLEMGVLSEMHRNYATNQICQVDIAETYDHKHQELSLEDKTRGLSKMSADISKSIYRKMATQGEVFSKEKIRTIKAAYYRIALDLIDSYNNDAVINGLVYDRHSEGEAVEMFAENVMQAGCDFLDPDHSMDTPFMPSWSRVVSAVPDIYEQLTEAVKLDMEEFGGGAYDIKQHPKAQLLRQRMEVHVARVYGDDKSKEISDSIFQSLDLTDQACLSDKKVEKWNETDVYTITYGDSIRKYGERPLQTLNRFLNGELKDVISAVHILPFCPFSSDDGFSVIDYQKIDPDLGSWEDINKIGEKDYFVIGDDYADVTNVVRPRSSPLLHLVETADGEKEVWGTFSADQVDLNFRNPEVLLEFVKIIKRYIDEGIRVVRLDAVAFLWKESGSSCVHLPETHELIKLLRLVIEHLDPKAIVITETNVPNKENLSYFGNDNEAHMIYNFSLPPLLVNTLLSGDSRHLKTWLMSMPPARQGRSYFNFIASHDGIGLRPAEGLLSDIELKKLTETLCSFGGEISMRKLSDGELKPYEANISLFSAMAGTIEGGKDDLQVDRFLCAHMIMLALEGVPAIYIHSLLGTENNIQGVANTGHLRTINRAKWDYDELHDLLTDKESHHSEVFNEMRRIISIRKRQQAFHPNATQYTLHLGNKIFAFWRESLDRSQSVFAIHNISNEPQVIAVSELNLIETDNWKDLLSGQRIGDVSESITLPAYGCAWLSNK